MQNNEKILFVPKFLEICDKIESGEILTKRGDPYAYGSVYTWKTALVNFRRYEDCRGIKLRYKDINIPFIVDFIQFCNRQGKSKNATGCILSRLYAFMNRPESKGLISPFTPIRLQESIVPVVNDLAEIDRLLELKLIGIDELVRDVYILQCNLGLRYSDMIRLLRENVSSRVIHNGIGHIISLTSQKTRTNVNIPVRSQAVRLLEKYGFGYIKAPCIQEVNARIKRIAKKAGLTYPVTISKTVGGEFKDFTFQKWEKITTHTARRSFATNAFFAGVNTRSIMLITGHSSEQSLRRYIGADSLDNALLLQDHPFFK